MNNILLEDYNNILKEFPNIDIFRRKTILITGATGLVGSMLTRFFLYCNKKVNLNVRVIALVRNKRKADKIFANYSQRNLDYVIADLGKDLIKIDSDIDYIIHAAAVTNSKLLIESPVESLETAVNGTEKILKLATEKNVYSVVYLSSMEVYGQPDDSEKTTEDKLGYIDLTNPRSGYPESKRLCESLCTAYATQYNLNVKVARLAQTFGAGVLPGENRVFAQFARSIINEENIVLHTEGHSEGNYVYISDAIYAILFLLLNGDKGQAYNIVNEQNHMSIRQMANLVVNNFGSDKQKVIIDIPKENMGYAPEVHMSLSGQKLMNIGWKPSYDLVDSYNRLIQWLKSGFDY
ncbi:NAD-dependent epimerase/dehydratase family protein [Limosilactobacillus rudii]|uniref:NAD-dependent epimerase/dehydratase family protein n=1 Tax=Limosilactobacillus rudii TaxID=2759755 RepID=UPI001C71FFD6|nr:NAD(P)-dependent oxidoreductase [Limosilactobacillus rudii]MCD7133695.1 NAD(P)-dependent oxidoreductase [Limosilactobacillus rudii]